MNDVSETDAKRIRAIMGEIAQAFVAGDAATLDRIFADDFTFTDPWNRVLSKEQWLRDVASGELRIESVDSEDFQLRQSGDTVRVSGQLNLKAHYSKANYNGSFRYLGIYERVNGEWRLRVTMAKRS